MVPTIPDHVVKRAAAAYHLDPQALSPLERVGAPDGAVYTCRRDDQDLFFKIRPIGAADVGIQRAQMGFAAHLRSSGIAVPQPLPTDRGDLMEVVDDLDRTYTVTLTRKAPGRHIEIPRDWTDDLIRAWGTTMGRMHAAATRWDTPGLSTWREEHAQFLAGCRDAAVGAVWEGLGADLAALSTDRAYFGAVHNDLHLGNLLLTDDGGLIVLDFDVCNRHWYTTDLAIALVHPIWDMRRRSPGGIRPFVDRFLAAYTAECPLEAAWRERLPLFMRYRMTLFVLAMSSELGHPQQLPSWVAEVRDWVCSGEPIADL